MEDLKKFLNEDSNDHCGYGLGSGYGFCDGNGFSESIFDNIYCDDAFNGNGRGDGDGDGYGYIIGDGYGDGEGNGFGYEDGSGDGLDHYNN